LIKVLPQLRPTIGPNWGFRIFVGSRVIIRRITCSAAVLALAIVAGPVTSVSAQTSPREVVLGVSKINRPAPVAATPEHDAAYLYDVAAALLRAGDSAAAQRQFEQLVALYPDSDGARRARRDLAALYGGGKPQAAVSQAAPSYLGRAEPAPVATQPAISAWQTTVRPAAESAKTAQSELRTTAGDLVFFSEGSAELGARARKALAAQAAWLARHEAQPILIEGHADEAGMPEDLLALSKARAEAVKARLVEEGIVAQRIRIAGYGAERRIALCPDQSCAGQNRRAATIVGGATAAQLAPR
jgi:outer membrane protein OmpA-like peptidoglycan-associated protein